ncbi:MAG: CHASE3 domain-containing protein [Xanthobacteraceae bacterium]|nr:CHASE3 domain-containing protein [Xanthobacteraceae bacterium]
MPLQRVILGIGLAVLLMMSAASVSLELKSRSDTALADHSINVLKQISDVRVLVHRAETSSGRFMLTPNAEIESLYRDVAGRVSAKMAELIEAVRDNPGQARLFEETRALIARRLAISDEMLRLRSAGDTAAVIATAARAEGFSVVNAINANFDKAVAEERRRLADQGERSKTNGRFLLVIDLAGVALILILATALTLSTHRSRRQLQDSLSASKAANEALEAAVAERTGHLVAAHEELRHSTAVLQNTFNSIAEAVLVLDAKGEILLANPAAETMLRYRPRMHVRDLRRLSVAYRADGSTRLTVDEMPSTRVLRGEPFDEQEIFIRPADDRAPLHLVVSGRPLRDATGAISGAALVYHDISLWRETERKLLQSQKLDALGKLTGGVAHDFNNMLTVITGTTETLVAGLAHQPTLQKTAEVIDQAAERCSELIQHLLAFARRQPLQPRDVDINSTVLDIAKLLRPTLGEQIEINSILEQEVATSHIDASQLANALLNMAINARDAMPDGGKLLLEVRNVVLDEAYAQANPDVSPGGYVMLAVTDTGTGMSKEVQDQVFEPFFTTKDVGKGSGLGMSMVYGFVRQSGGHIKIYSELGHGTTIRLYLPPGRGQAAATTSAVATPQRGDETILVVEDDALVRNFVCTQLQSLGYRTLAAADGPAAIAIIDTGEPFDLLFTDVILPGGMTGRQLAEEVTKRRPGTKVLYTSGYSDNAIVHQGRLDPGVLLLTKPYRMSGLAEMIRRALKDAA